MRPLPPCMAIAPRTCGCVWNALNILYCSASSMRTKFNEHQLGACVSFSVPQRDLGGPHGLSQALVFLLLSIFLSPSHFLSAPTLFSPRVSLIKSVVEGYTNSHLIRVKNHFTQSPLWSPSLFLEKRALSLHSLMPCPLKFQNPPQIF